MKSKPGENPDQLALVSQELREGKWFKNARRRAQRRKSAWNLLLPLSWFPLWGAITALLMSLASVVHTAIHPHAGPLFGPGPLSLGQALVLIPSLLAAVTPAMLLTNTLVYLIPAARRAMDAEDRNYPEARYEPSQRALFKLGSWILVICLPLILAGALVA